MSENMGHEAFIKERQRGRRQGERELLARSGVASEAELQALLQKARSSVKDAQPTAAEKREAAAEAAAETPRRPGETKKEHEARVDEVAELKLERLVESKLAPVIKALQGIEERFAKTEEAEKQAKSEAEEQATHAKEVKRFRRIAKSMGVKEEDLDDVQAMYERALVKMDEDDIEEMFGDKVPAKEQEANMKKILDERVRARVPAFFSIEKKAAEAKTESTTAEKPTTSGNAAAAVIEAAAKAAVGATAEQAQKTSTTGAAASPPNGANPAAAAKKTLDATRLSKQRFAEYKADPKGFREKYEQGLIGDK